MSYILDALRKADAERRGAPPGLTEPAPLAAEGGDADPDLPPATARPWAWVLGGVALALAAAGGWHAWRSAPAAHAPVAVVPAPAPVAAPAPAPVPAAPAPAPGPAAPSADALPDFPPPLPEPPKPPPAPAPSPAPAPAAAARPAPPPGIAPAPPSAERIGTVADLPDAVRRDFPRISVGGAMYSDRPADRMVVINGQVFHEGDAMGQGLVLRQIRLKSAVLEFRGHRVEIGY